MIIYGIITTFIDTGHNTIFYNALICKRYAPDFHNVRYCLEIYINVRACEMNAWSMIPPLPVPPVSNLDCYVLSPFRTYPAYIMMCNDMYYRILLNCFDIANSCWNIITEVTRTLAEMDVTNVALSSIHSARQVWMLAFEGINCATHDPITAVARHFMIILVRKHYYARQSHYPKLQNNIFINNIFINGP